MSIALVWLKRDLRLQDHAPLQQALASGLPVLLLYCFEPMLLDDKHYRQRHWRFVRQSLHDMAQQLPPGALYCVEQDALACLKLIDEQLGIGQLFSHQEVGLANTFTRDIKVQQWCDSRNISWLQSPIGAVIRGLTHRQEWDKRWQKVMRAPLAEVNVEQGNWLDGVKLGLPKGVDLTQKEPSGQFQQGGELAAWQTLESFFTERGKNYAYSLSSPALSQQHCSRFSAYLAWGNISLRQAYQSLLSHWQTPGWRRSLVALSSRLHWHCHFIQKFESDCQMQFQPVNAGYKDLPRTTGVRSERFLVAWQRGQTGIPMVDACMVCLQQTGYINFRMRAMLVSFLCHHLAVDWRMGVEYLASLFLDFEPGIHYSQFQMQAGVTGINTIRIYNPVKQGLEKDPDGEFVKTWLPQLAQVPAPLVHTPWQLTPMEQQMYQVQLGHDYPEPIVDIKQSYNQAKELLWQWRSKPLVKQEGQRLLARHVRPKR
ncbi:cryptochrome/deoxyribodipyrimidine photo-lyase family protein [Motilimonas pumila]|uniref:Deoxyribodipyrimidine photo-lyase n=1 Tax=Motilimonas pumila TaxID=2303987 RepID=A0A418YFB9_9GAMM|nr:deoxyribodipyrimidine photo-lyase [Motilimonas pumila]RJG47923.1 deoxyribodipyrimidine photo-lyase [Motilimonas pumila]